MNKTKQAKQEQEISVETALSQLEQLVNRLENGTDDLAMAFKLYEQAEQIVRTVHQQLTTYEEKLRIINQKGNIVLTPPTNSPAKLANDPATTPPPPN